MLCGAGVAGSSPESSEMASQTDGSTSRCRSPPLIMGQQKPETRSTRRGSRKIHTHQQARVRNEPGERACRNDAACLFRQGVCMMMSPGTSCLKLLDVVHTTGTNRQYLSSDKVICPKISSRLKAGAAKSHA